VIQSELPPDDAGRFYFFNSFFSKKLTEKDKAAPIQGQGTPAEQRGRRAHERLKKWTKVRGAGWGRAGAGGSA
jgi:hypothetical protein